MTSTSGGFPSPKDISTHRRARTLKEQEEITLSRRADQITEPHELVDFILEIATKKYRRGKRKFDFAVEIPVDNFRTWASNAKIGSPEWDRLDRQRMMQEVARLARIDLQRRVKGGVYWKLTSRCIAGTRLSFTIDMSVIRPL